MLIKISRVPIKEMLIYGFLPSFLKKLIYRLSGYDIGSGVSFGFGSIVSGKDVSIGSNTKIHFLTVIRGNTIRIGKRVAIGPMAIIDTPSLEIGDGTIINEQVIVGGQKFPESSLKLGSNSIVMQGSYINTARPVSIGNDTGVGGHSLIFSHGSWLSQFEGYPVKFEAVDIGNSVWLPWRVFVMPGTKIGDGSVIGANSLVSGEIPPKSLAVGAPARVIRQFPDFPKSLSPDDKVQILNDILDNLIRYFEFYGISNKIENNLFEFQTKKKKWIMRVSNGDKNEPFVLRADDHWDLYLSLTEIPSDLRGSLLHRNIMWIDIEKKERSDLSNDLGNEVAEFLSRYGVRLVPK